MPSKYSGFSKPDQDPSGIIYKEAVIIGNGPSAMALSYMFSGNWPYYNGDSKRKHPQNFLHHRMNDSADIPLVLQDLQYLSQGLEGRSSNPVSLLFDTLNHPGADVGSENPSLLQWKYHPQNGIDHTVIGSGLPGGSWQLMDGTMLTVSSTTWLELPGLSYNSWKEWSRNNNNSNNSDNLLQHKRETAASIARYYQDYVEVQGLSNNFQNFTKVTSVRPVDGIYQKLNKFPHEFNQLWQVCGLMNNEGNAQEFCYLTPAVILATGSSDIPNTLNIPGEDLPIVLSSVSSLKTLIRNGSLTRNSDPVIVVGAGLTAADAIIATLANGIEVIHVFRRKANDPSLVFRQLSAEVYPEYRNVYEVMQGVRKSKLYRAVEEHEVVRVLENREVLLRGPKTLSSVQASYVLILIGSKPDFSFLENKGKDLTVYPDRTFSCKSNPVDVDVYTMESVKRPGLFAMGPLVSDNFVRSAQGGALAITSALFRRFRTRTI